MSPLLESSDRSAIRRLLLTWFDRHRRDVPWRFNRDPYRIWVAEVMLQQTTVAAVVPYFERFVARYPTLKDLASAKEQDVLRLWEGLGYYRRARHLHAAARILHKKFDSRIPNDPNVLATLPGFGRYTVNAVLSQAYDRPLPILEANSQRVFARLLAETGDLRRAETRTRLWDLATDLLPKERAGDFNQAVMELGALVCTPTHPECPTCPLRKYCQASRQGKQDEIPRKGPRLETAAEDEVAVVLRDGGKVFVVQRPADASRWPAMWEFPHQPVEFLEAPRDAAQRLLQRLGFEGEVTGELTTIRHAVTRFRITMTCLEAERRNGAFRPDMYPHGRWQSVQALDRLPFSVPQRRLCRILTARKK
jgi:A/G-specific adenine glycosylase